MEARAYSAVLLSSKFALQTLISYVRFQFVENAH